MLKVFEKDFREIWRRLRLCIERFGSFDNCSEPKDQTIKPTEKSPHGGYTDQFGCGERVLHSNYVITDTVLNR